MAASTMPYSSVRRIVESICASTESATVREAAVATVRTLAEAAAGVATHRDTSGRSWTSGHSRVAAQHGNTRTVLGATERYHVLADVRSNNLTTLRVGVGENVLNQVVAKLVTGNCWTCQNVESKKYHKDLLSIRGMRGRSARASQTRSR